MSAASHRSPLDDERLLVLAPTGRDATLICEILAAAGLDGEPCEGMKQLCELIAAGRGPVILAEEAMTGGSLPMLTTTLAGQPAWSDLPVLVLTPRGAEAAVESLALRSLLEHSVNLTLLERPLRAVTLVSAARAALRARRRQHELRNELAARQRQEQALRDSERSLRLITDALPALIASLDESRCYRFANAAHRRWFGIEPEAIIGRTLAEVLGEQAARAIDAQLEEATADEQPVRWAGELRFSAGWTRHVDADVIPNLDGAGRVRGWYTMIADVTDRRRAEMRMAAEHGVTRILAESRSVEQALPAVLQCIRESFGLDLGELWIDDATGTLHRRALSCENEEPMQAMLATTDRLLPERLGAPGRAWRTLAPAWAVEIAHDPAFDRRDAALEAGLLSAFSLPIRAAQEPLGLMLFLSRQLIEPELALVSTLTALGRTIAQFIMRQRAEEALRLSEERFRAALHGSPITVFNQDRELRYTWVYNSRPVPAEEILGRTDRELVAPPEEAERMESLKRQVMESGRGARQEIAVQRDGAELFFDLIIEPLRDAAGAVVGITCAAMDITGRKQGERALAEWKERYEAAVLASRQVLYDWDFGAGELTWGGNIEQILGYTPEQMGHSPGRRVELIHPEDRSAFEAEAERARRRGAAFHMHYRLLRRDGRYVEIEDYGHVLRDAGGEPARVIGFMADVTRRRRAERQQALLAAIVESSEDAIIAKTIDGVITSWNRGAERLYGWTAEEVVGEPLDIIIPPKLASEARRMRDRVRRGRSVTLHETRRLHRDGRLIDIALTMFPIRNAAGEVTAISTIERDITARKQAEEHQKLLLAELNHRVKNNLAAVQSIATQTLQRSGSLDQFADSFSGRLRALARAHGLLTRTNWERAELRSLVDLALQPYRREDAANVHLEGPEAALRPKAAVAASMILHELATNATKYGALSVTGGSIIVRWWLEQTEPAAEMVVEWTEQGGPPLTPPSRAGFGTTMIRRGAEYELEGRVEFEWAPHGLRCRLIIPWTGRIAAGGSAHPRQVRTAEVSE